MNNVEDMARKRHAHAVAQQRKAEKEDALDFLMGGDFDNRHTDNCIHAVDGGEPCSRNYNPAPYKESTPNPQQYAGTGIGALYGFEGSERFYWELAGWNITKRREYA